MPWWVRELGNKRSCEHACVFYNLCLPVRVFHGAFPKTPASFSVTHAVWPPPYLPPPPQPFFLPRATFPVLLSLPAPASLDFVSDFPRKRLCAGHGVKNTAFLMHSLGKQTKRPLPPLSELASFFAAPLLVWHFLPIMFPVKDEFYIHLPAAALLVELVFVFSPQSINISFQFSSFS